MGNDKEFTSEKELFDACDAVENNDQKDACVLVFDSQEIAVRYHEHRRQNFPQIENGGWIMMTNPSRAETAVCRDKVPLDRIEQAVQACMYALDEIEKGTLKMDEFDPDTPLKVEERELPDPAHFQHNVPSMEEMILYRLEEKLAVMDRRSQAAVNELKSQISAVIGKHGDKAILAMQLKLAEISAGYQKARRNAQNN